HFDGLDAAFGDDAVIVFGKGGVVATVYTDAACPACHWFSLITPICWQDRSGRRILLPVCMAGAFPLALRGIDNGVGEALDAEAANVDLSGEGRAQVVGAGILDKGG